GLGSGQSTTPPTSGLRKLQSVVHFGPHCEGGIVKVASHLPFQLKERLLRGNTSDGNFLAHHGPRLGRVHFFKAHVWASRHNQAYTPASTQDNGNRSIDGCTPHGTERVECQRPMH